MSTDEPHLGGVLAAADVGGKQDATNYNSIFASRFAAFNELLSILKLNLHVGCFLKKPWFCQKLDVADYICVRMVHKEWLKRVGLRRNGSEFVLLEVDASDGVKMLSTKVLTGVDSETWRNDFERIRRGVVKNSLNWPNGLLGQLYGQGA